MNKERIFSKDRKERISNPFRFKPYQQMPFSPEKLLKPQLDHRRGPSTAKIRMRKIASRQIEDHFETRHVRYRSKQNQHCSSFRKKANRHNIYEDHQNQLFWVDKMAPRVKCIRQMGQQYLKEVSSQFERRKQWSETETEWGREEKIISQYNIIFEYRESTLPIAYLI